MVTSEPIGLDIRVVCDELICPGCDEPAFPDCPVDWEPAWGELAEFSHRDGSSLCRSRVNSLPAEPVDRATR